MYGVIHLNGYTLIFQINLQKEQKGHNKVWKKNWEEVYRKNRDLLLRSFTPHEHLYNTNRKLFIQCIQSYPLPILGVRCLRVNVFRKRFCIFPNWWEDLKCRYVVAESDDFLSLSILTMYLGSYLGISSHVLY